MSGIKNMDIFEFKRFCDDVKFTELHFLTKNQEEEIHNCMNVCCTFNKIRVDFNPNTITFLDLISSKRNEDRYGSYISFSNVDTITLEEIEGSGYFVIVIRCSDFVFTKKTYEYKIIAR